MSSGFHSRLDQTLTNTIQTKLGHGYLSTQIYLGCHRFNDLPAAKELIATSGFHLYTHSCLQLNLAAPPPSMFRTIQNLTHELAVVSAIGATTVVHIGSETTGNMRNGTLDNVITTLKGLPFPSDSERFPLLLENSAGEGRKLGSTLAELEYLFTKIREADLPVGLCLDTAHAFGAGIFDFSSKEEIDEMFELVDNAVGKDRFRLLHLNDSKVKFGSHNDRHENLGYGYIWKESLDPCAYLLQECRQRQIDVILETPAEHCLEDYQWCCRVRQD